jgi:hypothetical protein
VKAAADFAAGAGDGSPTDVQEAQSTRGHAVAEAVGGDTISDTTPSTTVTMHGHFVLDDVPRPQGTAPPTGSVLTLVIDNASGSVTDVGLTDSAPNLARVGAVSRDSMP